VLRLGVVVTLLQWFLLLDNNLMKRAFTYVVLLLLVERLEFLPFVYFWENASVIEYFE